MFLALAQRLFGDLQIVNVGKGSEPFDDPPFPAIERGAIPCAGGAILAVLFSRRRAAPFLSVRNGASDEPAVAALA
jgi:hypothetical protein